MGNRNWIYLAVAVVLGLLAVVLANAYFSGVEEQQQRVAEEQKLARIVVTTQPLEFAQPLTTENLRMANYPANSVPEGAFFSIPQALQGGKVALQPMVPNEPVLRNKVNDRAILSAKLPEDMRAVSIPISAITAVSGFVRPGDLVDILLTRDEDGGERVEVILERVQILAINQTSSENANDPQVGSTATVLVDLFNAQKLTLAQRLGQLSVVLRNIKNQEQGTAVVVTPGDVGTGYYRRAPRASFTPQTSAPAPTRSAASEPAPRRQSSAAPSAPPPPRGPSMTVMRGTDSETYTVDRLRGN